jgi:hypothetical protein
VPVEAHQLLEQRLDPVDLRDVELDDFEAGHPRSLPSR